MNELNIKPCKEKALRVSRQPTIHSQNRETPRPFTPFSRASGAGAGSTRAAAGTRLTLPGSPLLTEFQVSLQHCQVDLEVTYVQSEDDCIRSDLGLH